jgi:hypothetical protein
MYECRFCGKKLKTSSGRSRHEGHKHDITQKLTKDFLVNKYIKEKMTVREISSVTGFGEWQISGAFKKLGIQRRSTGEALRVRGTMAGEKHPLYGTKGGFYGKHHSDKSKKLKSDKMKDYLKRNPKALERLKRNLEKRRQNSSGKNNPNWKGGHYKECSLCGKRFWVQPSGENTRFCSIDCANEWIRISGILSMKNNPNWNGGLSFKPYTPEFNAKLKREIKIRDGGKCKLCDSPKRLAVHHINYDKNDCRDENLITLCTNCNGKVNFNRNYWERYLRNVLSNKHYQVNFTQADIEKNPSESIFHPFNLAIQSQKSHN